ncbi:hypothetical protein Tco_1575709 [Tanacetum coccineum]
MQHLGVISRLCSSGSTILEMKLSKWKMNCGIEGLPLNIKGNVTSSRPVDLHEAIEMAQGLMYQVVQELGENSGSYAGKLPYCEKYGQHHTDACPPTCHNYERAGHKTKEDPKFKEDREVMLLVSDVAKKDITRTSARTMGVKAMETKFKATNKILRTIKGKTKETLKEITKHQPILKEDAEHLAGYTAYVLKLQRKITMW